MIHLVTEGDRTLAFCGAAVCWTDDNRPTEDFHIATCIACLSRFCDRLQALGREAAADAEEHAKRGQEASERSCAHFQHAIAVAERSQTLAEAEIERITSLMALPDFPKAQA